MIFLVYYFFFFQAEDGIRDKLVTGVQTCALPIWSRPHGPAGITKARHSYTRGGRRRARYHPRPCWHRGCSARSGRPASPGRSVNDGRTKLHYAVVVFIIAGIASALGFRGIAGMSADI